MRTLRLSIIVTAVTCILHGQQSSPPSPPIFRSGIDLVEVDVSVLDKDRYPVRDLISKDFTVLEDGKSRPILSFTAVELPEAEAQIAPAFRGIAHDVVSNTVPQEGRLVVILMDGSIGFLQQRDAREIGAGLIDQLGPGDLGAVVYSSGFKAGTKSPQNFTTDHARLLAAIEHSGFGMTSPPDMTAAGLTEPSGDADPSGENYCQPRTLNAIANIAEALSDVPHRRKLLVIVGTRMVFIETGDCAAIVKAARERAFRALDVANMTVDVVDPTGLQYVDPRARAALLERQGDLVVLPARTGGRVVNSNEPLVEILRLFQESRSYYLLAFQPANPSADGHFHKIEVKVNRKGLRLQARRGYNSTPSSKATFVNAPPLLAALAGSVPTTGISVTATAAPFAVPGKPETAVAIIAGIHSSPGVMGRSFEVITAVFDPQGRQVGSVHQRIDLAGPIDSVGPVDVLSRLNLKPGLYEIRIAVADADGGHTGSVFTWVEVPAFDETPLALSGFAVTTTPAWPATPIEAIADLLPFPPTTKRAFARDDRVTALLKVYQGDDQPEPVVMAAHVIDQLGRTVVTHSSTLSSGRFVRLNGVDFRIDFSAAQFGPGDYLLTVDAAIGKRTARRELRFSVE